MPPHISWEAAIAIIGLVSGFIAFLFRLAIGTPMNNLSEAIDKLSRRIDEDLRAVDNRLDEQEIHLARHDEQIDTLFKGKKG